MSKNEQNIPISKPSLIGNEAKYVNECIESTWISSKGRFVDSFEERFAEYHGINHALTVSNGTVALHLALETLGVGEGDEVIVPDLTFAATINAVLHASATPVIVDVDISTFNIDPTKIEEVISEKTKAIIPVHLYGNPCNMDKISKIAKNYNLFIVEDCAEALGSSYKEKKVGTFGEVSTYSFYGNKTVTTGEGGMLLFKDSEKYDRAKILRDHGMNPNKRYWHDYVGYNYRMTNLQASIGVAQMEQVQGIVKKKIDIGKHYCQRFRAIESIQLQETKPESVNTYWLFTFRLKNKDKSNLRDRLQENLSSYGIETRKTFYPLSSMDIYKHFSNSRMKNSIQISKTGLSLPTFYQLAIEEIDFVADKVIEFLKNN